LKWQDCPCSHLKSESKDFDGLMVTGGLNPRPYVPRSCCVLDSNGEISETNLKKCQTNMDGPPARRQGSQYAGTYNSALNYRVRTCLLPTHSLICAIKDIV